MREIPLEDRSGKTKAQTSKKDKEISGVESEFLPKAPQCDEKDAKRHDTAADCVFPFERFFKDDGCEEDQENELRASEEFSIGGFCCF